MDSPDTGADVKNILEVIGEQTEKFEHKNCAETWVSVCPNIGNLTVSLSEQCPDTCPASISWPILELNTSMDFPDPEIDEKNILEVIVEQTEKFKHKNYADTWVSVCPNKRYEVYMSVCPNIRYDMSVCLNIWNEDSLSACLNIMH